MNEKIRHAESSFSSVSSVDAQVQLAENQIADLEEKRSKLEEDLREAKYDEQIREKSVAIRQKESDRDRANGELSALNRQADSRAQLTIKRNDLNSKNGQIAASCVSGRNPLAMTRADDRISSHSQRFKELVGTDLEAESMEEKVTLAAGWVIP